MTPPQPDVRIEMKMIPRLVLFPVTAKTNQQDHLVIGGCDTVKLVAEFGTPLYVFDEETLRGKCAEYKHEFGKVYPDTTVIYACKAFINKSLLRLLNEEGLGLDVVSGGEMGIAKAAGFPAERVYFHGNNKSLDELKQAVEWGIGRIVVDNFHELEMLAGLGKKQDIMLRLTPGIDPHTHKYITTGLIDSKFGFTLAEWEKAVETARSKKNLNLVGLHFHVGSLLFETEPYEQSINVVLDFAAKMKARYGFELKEMSVGGGFAIQYTVTNPPPPISTYAQAISGRIKAKCSELKLALPRLVIEPGRSIVGRAGVALYTVGAVKDITGVRCYVSVDGGMADNIRPAIYGSVYEALVANKVSQKEASKVTVSGKYCESGDILIKDIDLPLVSAGDIIAIPASGAYCLAMSSNYNAAFKPAVVMVRDGKARLIRRRETTEDLTRCDL